tara:strand:- start:4092 stop:5015 length:924 start_codon:yes stop_codon:yes gene_type:complete
MATIASPYKFSLMDGNLRLAAILHNEVSLLLADRASLRNHPSIVNYGNIAGSGSETIRVPLLGVDGYDLMASTNEATAPSSATALTYLAPEITVARFALQRAISDLAQMTNSGGGPSLDILVQDFAGAFEMTVTSQICALFGSFSNSVGSATVDLSVDDFFAAVFQLEQSNVTGKPVAVLAPVQVSDLQNSIRQEGGALQYIPATQAMLEAKGQGYVGEFAGVDIFKSDKVATSTGRQGGMFVRGAIGYCEGSMTAPAMLGSAVQANGPVVIDIDRSFGDTTDLIGNAYFGVAELQDSMGVLIETDA